MIDYVAEPLGKHHNRTHFDCGVAALNEYLAKYAVQDMRRKAAAVFVLVERTAPTIVIGYYTLSATSVRLASLPPEITKRLPRYPEIPAILIGRLARSQERPGTGARLLSDAISRCVRASKDVAASLIVVDSKGETATNFYNKFGFISLPNLPNRMFLAMATAEKL